MLTTEKISNIKQQENILLKKRNEGYIPALQTEALCTLAFV